MVSAAFWFLATWFVFRRNQLVVSFIKCNCPSVMWVPLALTFLRLVHCIQNFPLWHVPVILGSKAFNFLSSLLLKLTMHAFVGKTVSFYSLCALVNDNNQSHRRHHSLPESFCIRDLRWWSNVHLRSSALYTSLSLVINVDISLAEHRSKRHETDDKMTTVKLWHHTCRHLRHEGHQDLRETSSHLRESNLLKKIDIGHFFMKIVTLTSHLRKQLRKSLRKWLRHRTAPGPQLTVSWCFGEATRK